MTNTRIFSFLALLSLFIIDHTAEAQQAIAPNKSPLSVARAKYNNTYIQIVYSQPHKRGRRIFGGLVPYGKVWRMGANDDTEITLTRDVKVNNMFLKGGTYSMFAIPRENQWTIIFNSDLGQWGSYNYSEAKDVLRVDVPADNNSLPMYEPFTIKIEQNGSNKNQSEILLLWDKTKVTIPITLVNDGE